MVVLQPTSPLRLAKDINTASKIISRLKTMSLFSISSSLEHPYETIEIKSKNNWKHILKKSSKFFRRQDFDIKSFFINGAIYIIHRDLVKKKKIFSHSSHCFYKMPKHRSLDINDVSEATIVESILKARG